MAAKPSPMMQQFHDAKQACPDALLLFRMGDFYELFHDDAKTAAQVLGLTLTSRDKGEDPIPMAGFPHHQLDGYLGKLVSKGYRVAVCEQVEDPKKAKGLVKREVTRIVTPGTVTDEALLDPRECNYLAAIMPGEPTGAAWVDLSTGKFFASSFPKSRLEDELSRVGPSEVLMPEDAEPLPSYLSDQIMTTRRPDWAFGWKTASDTLSRHFGTITFEGFGFDESPGDKSALRSAGAVLDYLSETQKYSLEHIDEVRPYKVSETLEIDEASRRSLEIVRTYREGRREGSLLHVLDRCVSAMGSRLLAEWVMAPLTKCDAIDYRLDAVDEMVADSALTTDLREALRQVYDVERLLARVTTGKASPRDLSYLGRTLACLPVFKAKLTARKSPMLSRLESEIDLCADLRARLEAALDDDCPLTSREGGFIRDGFNAELDQLRELRRGGKQWIAEYQARESQEADIPNLKVGFNRVFGYYIEVTNAHRDKIPETYIRKQTLKNAERYITPELKEYEEKVLTADEKACELEYDLFCELRDAVAEARRRMYRTAVVLAHVDVLASLAELARDRNYCRPKVTADPMLEIVDGRHPVLDLTEPHGTFVPNDAKAGAENGTIMLITGPNMAGKSTYIRQIALITLMAQIGGFVPATDATIGVADRIFARVGASDELARGQSTFMVEMTETARILNMASERSLVILDEIGRGTSTYDGISLAWSVVEHLHDMVKARTFFATHYHELTDLSQSLERVRNLNVAVREWEDEVRFLHKIVEGAADKSYGIHVARLAGVPKKVVERAKDILSQLEDEHVDASGKAKIARRATPERRAGHVQMSLFGPTDHPLIDDVRRVDVQNTTPLEALQLLNEWQQTLKADPGDRRKG